MSSTIDSRKGHRFGGDWTDAKLQVLEGYLRGYTTALKDKPSRDRPFQKVYIDAFAGTGYRESCTGTSTTPLFPDLADEEPQGLLDGSARVALKNSPRFDHYVFIDRSAKRCLHLEDLKKEFPELARDIFIRKGDANDEIQKMCERNWRASRAVLFLDPYGMQVDWKTIESVAKTEAIDLWLLFPLGIGVNRLLTKSGDIPDTWRRRLDSLLGTEEWYDEFYKVTKVQDLFGDMQEQVNKASMETIGRYFVDRLKTIFPSAGVTDNPGVLRNSANNPLYLLCFAAGNKRGGPIALRIAEHLLKDLR
jgi:three-Cys-motif partner protein